MPTKATKPELPPAELRDRQEGYGTQGIIYGYPEYRDDFEWPVIVTHRSEFEEEASETSDPGDSGWWRVEDQRVEEINDYQGTPYII